MRMVTNDEVRAHSDFDSAVAAIISAFRDHASGNTGLQPRHRIVGGTTKLSTMAAILPAQKLAGAKVYTTVDGRFRFVVLLFDASTGDPIACMEADAFTEIRTAATTVAVANTLANPDSSVLSIFGTGVQAGVHALALARNFPLAQIRIVSRGDASRFVHDINDQTGIATHQSEAEAAVDGANIVVTATRSKLPVFAGANLSPGAFVAAIGCTLPDGRELDDTAFRRAANIVVEWAPQAFSEAGDLIQAEKSGAVRREAVTEFGDILNRHSPGRGSNEGITIFKSVGIALEDVAVAGSVWQQLVAD